MQKNFLIYVNNCFNDTKREAFLEVKQAMTELGLLNDEIAKVIDEKIESVKENRKIKNKQKPRHTAYTIFLKEERVQVKEALANEGKKISSQELTKIVSQSWASVSEERKADLAARAKLQKERYELENPEASSEGKKEKKKRVKKEKKEEASTSDEDIQI